ncbi:hypothetical protein Naga_100853g1 [Nannochloropsis gaditana]|uniref:Uncharacterized protein n=1 Tax=Nannochloropsis gaditana TaxID=72520 RepID=W7T9G5_9STRA|nr:hypothetical protein Naga_100853g1 [Nannochloropsis gaditana]
MREEGKEKRMEIKGCIRVVQVLREPMCHALKWYFSVADTSRKSGIVSVVCILHGQRTMTRMMKKASDSW